MTALSVTAGAMAVGFLIHKSFFSKPKCVKPKVNLDLQKDNPKVVHAFDIEELGDKAVYCRCWRSKKVIYSIVIQAELTIILLNTFLIKSWMFSEVLGT